MTQFVADYWYLLAALMVYPCWVAFAFARADFDKMFGTGDFVFEGLLAGLVIAAAWPVGVLAIGGIAGGQALRARADRRKAAEREIRAAMKQLNRELAGRR